MTGSAGDQPIAYRLEDSLGFLVNQASRSIRRRFERELACRNLTMAGLTAAAQAILSEVVRQLPPEQVATCKQVLRGICSALDPQRSLEEGGGT